MCAKAEPATDSPAPAFTAVLLAGGRSRRMGRDKARLPHPVTGLPLVAHQLATLRAAGATELLLSLRAGTDYPKAGTEVARVFDDGLAGPLPALAAALARAAHPLVLVLAVDLPWIKPATLRALLAAAREIDPAGEVGTVLRGTHGFEPLCAVYPRRAASHFAAAVRPADRDSGGGGLQPVLAAGVAAGWLRVVAGPDAAELTNWNTPDDLAFGAGAAPLLEKVEIPETGRLLGEL
jgi:molybdopterin-guanine dinucleotide biosynthesis protein A